MKRPIAQSLDALLSIEELSKTLQERVRGARIVVAWPADSHSGSRFLRVTTDGDRQLVVKRMDSESDWLMRVSRDDRCRQVTTWQLGLHDSLPPTITSGIVGAALDGAGWALLMTDFADSLLPAGDDRIAVDDHERLLATMAEWDSVFFEKGGQFDSEYGFLDLRDRYQMFAPHRCEPVATGDGSIPDLIVAGWAQLELRVEQDVAELIRSLHRDPGPLCQAMDRLPTTVVHGDWKYGNLGILRKPDPQVILLDWGQVGLAPPPVELAWYLAVNAARLPVSKEEAIASYRDQLASRLGPKFSESWWQPALDLSLLGAFLQLGWPKLYGVAFGATLAIRAHEQAELEWWSDRVRTARRWLDSSSSGTG